MAVIQVDSEGIFDKLAIQKLKDEFAGLAMASLMSRPDYSEGDKDQISEVAYNQAESMLRDRSTRRV